MSAGELEHELAGTPGKLIRERYRKAASIMKNEVCSPAPSDELRHKQICCNNNVEERSECTNFFTRRYCSVQGRLSCLMINDLDAGLGRFGDTQVKLQHHC